MNGKGELYTGLNTNIDQVKVSEWNECMLNSMKGSPGLRTKNNVLFAQVMHFAPSMDPDETMSDPTASPLPSLSFHLC